MGITVARVVGVAVVVGVVVVVDVVVVVGVAVVVGVVVVIGVGVGYKFDAGPSKILAFGIVESTFPTTSIRFAL